MKNGLFGRIAAVMTVCAIGLTGCGLDVDSFLQPPRAQGEQKAVQTALETYLQGNGTSAVQYTLQYPVEGAHTSAFVLCDDAGNPMNADTANEAQLAVAFYKLTVTDEMHVHLLRRSGNGWMSVADCAGFGAGILQAAFGDLDGDGVAELCTGWDTYNSRDHRLAVLSLADNLSILSDDGLYTRLFVGRLNHTDRDSLLLFRITDSRVSATLETLQNGRVNPVDTVSLDEKIQQFDGMTLCRLDEEGNGLFLDGVYATGTRVTELIYADDQGLHAPFFDATTHTSSVTQRPGYFASRDINGDLTVDIPTCWVLSGYEDVAEKPSTAYGVRWRSWNKETDTWQNNATAIVNTTAGYMISLSEEKSKTVTTQYDEETACLTLLNTETNQPFLKICPKGEAVEEGYFSLFSSQKNGIGYDAWFDETVLDRETVRYMVSLLEE